MDCSIVIPHRDRLTALGATLHSLSQQVTSRRFEVIVVDDGSVEPPDSLFITQFSGCPFAFVKSRGKGISAARNAGWTQATGRVILFLDCDQMTKPDFVENSCLPFDHHPGSIIQFGERNFLPDSADLAEQSPWLQSSRPDERFRVFRILSCNMAAIRMGWHLCYGHNVAVRRETLVEAGGFDEDFTGWGLEDCEFAFRLVSAGAKLIFNPGIAAYHQHHATLDKQGRYERWSKNLRVFEEKHPYADVKLQYIMKEYFDPHSRMKDWVRCVLAMEHSSRARTGSIAEKKESYVLTNPSMQQISEALEAFPDHQILAMVPRREFMKSVAIQLDPNFQSVGLHIFDDY